MALGNILITCVPTPAGVVTTKYRDGDDSAATPPSTPEIGQPAALNSTEADIPLATASTGGTAPLAYELSRSTTSALAGFAVTDAAADFSGDGVYTMTGLTASTQYWVRLATVDADFRRSGYSSVQTFTTQAAGGGDVTAPTAPSSLAATSTTPGTADLTWVNGTDAVGIAFTDVIRGNASGGVPTNTGTVISTVTGDGTSYTDVNAPVGQEVFYRVQHRDAAGNVSAKSGYVYVTIDSNPAGTITWNPGHGVRSSDDSEDSKAACISRNTTAIDWLADSPYMSSDGFAMCMVRWGRMNTTGSTYDWDIPDALLAYAKARGRKLVLMVMFKAFGASDSNNLIPADLRTSGYLATGLNSNGNSICIGEMWNAVVMNRFITFLQALGARYNSDTSFEGVSWPESSTWGTNASNNAAYTAQLKRLYPASKAAFPNSNSFANLNSITVGGTSSVPSLMEAAYQAGIGFACPDAREETGAKVFRGESGATRDYRGKMPCLCVVSASTYDFAVAQSPSNPTGYIVNWLQTEGCTHHAYRKYTWWNTALASIAADSAVATTCPLNYNGTCS